MELSQLFKYRDMAIAGHWKEIERMFNHSIQLNHVGVKIDLSEIDHPVAYIDEVAEYHKGGIGSDAINGGIISILADLSLGLLGLQYFKEGMTATAQLQVNFLKPFRTSKISATSTMTHRIGNRIYGTVELKNHQNDICAIAYGILATGISL